MAGKSLKRFFSAELKMLREKGVKVNGSSAAGDHSNDSGVSQDDIDALFD